MSIILRTVGLVMLSCISLIVLSDPLPPLVDQKLLLRYLADKSAFTLIDARSPEEFQQGHINGARNIPHDRIDTYRQQLPAEKTAPILTYCKTGKRATQLQNALLALGYVNVRVLPAEQIFWNASGPPVFNCGVASTTPRSGVTPGSNGNSSESPSPMNRGERQ